MERPVSFGGLLIRDQVRLLSLRCNSCPCVAWGHLTDTTTFFPHHSYFIPRERPVRQSDTHTHTHVRPNQFIKAIIISHPTTGFSLLKNVLGYRFVLFDFCFVYRSSAFGTGNARDRYRFASEKGLIDKHNLGDHYFRDCFLFHCTARRLVTVGEAIVRAALRSESAGVASLKASTCVTPGSPGAHALSQQKR